MKTLLVLLLVAFVVFVIIRGLRKGRGSPLPRQFPGPDLNARNDADSTFLYTAATMDSEPSYHHAGHHGADCTPSHDAGAGCSADGGGGGGSD